MSGKETFASKMIRMGTNSVRLQLQRISMIQNCSDAKIEKLRIEKNKIRIIDGNCGVMGRGWKKEDLDEMGEKQRIWKRIGVGKRCSFIA